MWLDYDFEYVGCFIYFLCYDKVFDCYVLVDWSEVFCEIGVEFRVFEFKEMVFYVLGYVGFEVFYFYVFFVCVYGNNNLLQLFNMCYEMIFVNLKIFIGIFVGICMFEDFEQCDVIFFFGQNIGMNSLCFFSQLKVVVECGCRIVIFNLLCECGLIEFVDLQNIV